MSQVSIASVAPRVTLDTYRALRLGMVAAGLLLLVSVVLECLRIGGIPGSISATFYSPVRSIFVATLLTVGLALVAIKGRPGWENGLLDIAGLLVPLVAFVPTPVTLASIADGATLRYTCPDRGQACVPPELAPMWPTMRLPISWWAASGLCSSGCAGGGCQISRRI